MGQRRLGKPVDRRRLRDALAAKREALVERRSKQSRLIGFDFDCTLTVRHFYKVFAWGYSQGNEEAHPHCQAFFEFCRDRELTPRMRGPPEHEDLMVSALEDFCRHAGEGAFREVFREIFLGGAARIAAVAAWLGRMRAARMEFAIVTAGTSVTVLRALAVVPEWLPFFPSSRVWDSSQGRHAIRSVAAQKALILRDLCPHASRIILVDDALKHDRPPKWVLEAAQVELFEELPYEGPGVNKELLEAVEAALLR